MYSRGRQGSKKHGLSGLSIPLLRKLVGSQPCMKCGRPMARRNLVIHHINENHRDHYINNLAIICRSCHRWVHRGGNGQVGAYRYRTNPRAYGSNDYTAKFDLRWREIGGVGGFKKLYGNDDISTHEIGRLMGGISRERVRQLALRLGIPTRGVRRVYINREVK